jgi:hypothetical protein
LVLRCGDVQWRRRGLVAVFLFAVHEIGAGFEEPIQPCNLSGFRIDRRRGLRKA